MRLVMPLALLMVCLPMAAQAPAELDLQALKQGVVMPQAPTVAPTDTVPTKGAIKPKDVDAAKATPASEGKDSSALSKEDLQARENAKLEAEVKALKAKDKGPRRFAADLFDSRQPNPSATTEGGIAEDYVLGTGDQLGVNVFGSATFEVPAQVDGRGEILIPKVGSVKVAGLTLGAAKRAVQGLVGQQFSRTTVDLQVLKLREVRVFVMGEVYRGGGYLVPSLSSLVNVLGLAGGPTSSGSFRDIRVVRGGQIIHSLDLYPLRAEGVGNINFSLQNGDVVFVPVVGTRLMMEGAFLRLAAPVLEGDGGGSIQLELRPEESAWHAVRFMGGLQPSAYASLITLQRVDPNGVINVQNLPNTEVALRGTAMFPGDVLRALGQAERTEGVVDVAGHVRVAGRFSHQAGLRVKDLLVGQDQLLPDTYMERGELVRTSPDQRQHMLIFSVSKALAADPLHNLELSPRDKLTLYTINDFRIPQWKVSVAGPLVKPGTFDLIEGMGVADLIRQARMLPDVYLGRGELLRTHLDGRQELFTFDVAKALAGDAAQNLTLAPQDKVTLFTINEFRLPAWKVSIAGPFVKAGTFDWMEGMRAVDLILRARLLPDAYLGRGEVWRTYPDERQELFSFDVSKALAGDPAHNLALTPRDKVTLYTVTELRLAKKVTVLGAFTKPGTFDWAENMRASDLVFRAGIPQLSANRFYAELAHTRDGKPSEIVRLELAKLTTTEGGSPVDLKDDAVNPKLEPNDVLSLYEKPDYRVHRTVRISGQVARPGSYILDQDRPTLSQLIQRAGGLTAEAMPKAGVLLRSALAEVGPGAKSIHEIMDRLNETKLMSEKSVTAGENSKVAMFRPPILHDISTSKLNRLVVDFEAAVKGDKAQDTELLDGDEVVVPRIMDTAYVVGESSSPFGSYKVVAGMRVGDILKKAGGTTRNADTWNIRLVKADGHIVDTYVNMRYVEPGDTVIVPQRIRRDTSWQDDLTALTPLALILNIFASTGHL